MVESVHRFSSEGKDFEGLRREVTSVYDLLVDKFYSERPDLRTTGVFSRDPVSGSIVGRRELVEYGTDNCVMLAVRYDSRCPDVLRISVRDLTEAQVQGIFELD